MTTVSYKKEYNNELERLEMQGLSPIGINSHLSSYETFVEWKKLNEDLFSHDDKARKLI